MFAKPFRLFYCLVTGMILTASGASSCHAQASDGDRPQIVARAVAYLQTKGQAEDGSFSRQTGPAVTALVVSGLLRNGRSADEPWIAKSLKYLETFARADGGFYQQGSLYRNYETSVVMMCLADANKDGRYDALLNEAQRFVAGLQWDESEGEEPSSFNYGGAGYGSHKRPDLSNTSFLIDALSSMKDVDQEAMAKALQFVSRCQNLESPENTTPFPAKNPDGGFYYTPAAGGESQAGLTDNGGLRSYASMTYAGLKSMIFAGVERDDARVQAAWKWIQRNYDLKNNPGMGAAGLFYYYHTFAKALSAMKADQVPDAEGNLHDWKRELIVELKRRQRDDGSWINTDNPRWMEGDANLVTAYALLALSYCQ